MYQPKKDPQLILNMARLAVDKAFEDEYKKRIRGILPGGLLAIDRYAHFNPPLQELETALEPDGSDEKVDAALGKIRAAIQKFSSP